MELMIILVTRKGVIVGLVLCLKITSFRPLFFKYPTFSSPNIQTLVVPEELKFGFFKIRRTKTYDFKSQGLKQKITLQGLKCIINLRYIVNSGKSN